MPGSSSATTAWDEALRTLGAAAIAGVTALALALASPLRAQGGDTVPGRLGMATLRCRGNQDLSDVEWVARLVSRGANVYFVRPGQEGRALVSSFGPGPAWLGAPFAGGLARGTAVTDDLLRERARIAAASAVSLAAALVAAGARALVSPWVAAGLSLAAALSFAGVATLAQGLWQQTAELPFLAGALAAALWANRFPALLPVAAACAACAAWLRPADLPMLVAVAALAAVRALRVRRSLGLVAAALGGALLGAAPVITWNLWYFDTPLSIAQWSANARITEHVFSVSPGDVALGLAGLLVSPGRGVALFAPLVPVVATLAALFWRSSRASGERAPATDAVILLAGVTAEWMLAGTFFKWWGGAGFGPRLLAGVVWTVPALAALLWPFLDRPRRAAIVAAAALGAVLGLTGAFRFDLSRVEMELDAVHRPEPFFSMRAGPWSSFAAPRAGVRDAPPGPFVYCGAHSLGAAP